jgi:hypothetical protein
VVDDQDRLRRGGERHQRCLNCTIGSAIRDATKLALPINSSAGTSPSESPSAR